MAALALGALAVVAVIAALRLFVTATPTQVKSAAITLAALSGIGLAVLLVVTGRGGQAFWTVALLGPAAWRYWKGRRAAATFARGGEAAPGQASDVETEALAMRLDHDSGRMMGHVKAGRFAGRDLADLDLGACLALLAELSALDPDGVPLLEAWLDRAHPEWRDAPPPRQDGPLSRAEALDILGLAEGASPAEIKAAHRRLMRGAHPDQGGSDWLAARLNEARDVLLSE
jgi:DnaJ-domain-containing protein 1